MILKRAATRQTQQIAGDCTRTHTCDLIIPLKLIELTIDGFAKLRLNHCIDRRGILR